MDILSRKNYGGARYLLVHDEDVWILIHRLTAEMQEAKLFVSITTKPYSGSKYENATWVIVG